ncbi:hypothetical protein [Streptacidiphilus sp. PAMC 29251]
MRRRSAALLLSGALAVGVLVIPSIQRHESSGDARILGVSVNGDNSVVLGPAGSSEIVFSITAEDDSGISSVDRVGLWGPSTSVLPASATHCVAKTAKISVCTGTSSVDVAKKQIFDDMAGQWYVQATVHAHDGDELTKEKAGSFSIKKDGVLTEYGAPHTAPKGSLIGIGGQLKKPDWDSGVWVSNTKQPVQVQFCPKNCVSPTVVAETTTDENGMIAVNVRTTVTGVYTLIYAGAYWAEPVRSTPAQVTVE